MEPIKDFCTAVDAYMQHAAELNAIMKKYPPGESYTPIVRASIHEQFELHFEYCMAAEDAIRRFVEGIESGKIQLTAREVFKMMIFDRWVEQNPAP